MCTCLHESARHLCYSGGPSGPLGERCEACAYCELLEVSQRWRFLFTYIMMLTLPQTQLPTSKMNRGLGSDSLGQACACGRGSDARSPCMGGQAGQAWAWVTLTSCTGHSGPWSPFLASDGPGGCPHDVADSQWPAPDRMALPQALPTTYSDPGPNRLQGEGPPTLKMSSMSL